MVLQDDGYGGAMLVVDSLMTIESSSFIDNAVVGYGYGGAFLFFGSTVTIKSCLLKSNTAAYSSDYDDYYNSETSGAGDAGGAMYTDTSTVIIETCSIESNTADAGAMYFAYSTVTIKSCSIESNSATNGGAMYVTRSRMTIESCSFINNAAGNGGAMYVTSSTMTIESCSFINNAADDYHYSYGGAMYVSYSTVTIESCSFINNTAYSAGGLLYNIMSEIAIFGSFLDDTNGIYSISSLTADYSSCLAGEYGDCECDDSSYCSCTPANCKKCEPGKYSNVSGAPSVVSCVSCEAGKYNSDSGTTECFACGSGMYSTTDASGTADGNGVASGATTCSSCPAGKYQNNSAGYYCESCEAGEASTVESTICISCVPGRYADSKASAECAKCDPGKHQAYESGIICEICEAGKSSPSASHICIACGPGRFTSSSGEEECDECSSGTYANKLLAATSCTKCSVGMYLDTTGYTSRGGETSCSHCEQDYYREDNICYPCPEGASCDAFTTTQSIDVQKGYYRFTPNSTNFYECRYESACTATSNETGDSTCGDSNGKGPLCAYCSEEFYMDVSTRACKKCSGDWNDPSIQLLLVGVMIIVMICTTMICLSLNYLKRLWGVTVAILVSADKSPFTILWFFFQTTTQFVNKYDEVRYPQPFKGLIAILQLITIEFTSFPTMCIDADFYAVLLFTICWWPMIAALAFLLYFTARYFSGDSSRMREVLYACVVFVLILFHSSIVTVIFKTFDCTEEYDAEGSEYDDGDGTTRFLLADMTLPCDGSTHKSYESVAYIAIAFYVVLVPLFFVLALRNRHIYPELAKPLNFLVREVRLEVWWYEVVALVWRFVITGVLLLIPDVSLRLIFTQILATMMIALCGSKSPYLSKRNNNLAIVVNTTLFFIVLFTTVLFEGTLKSDLDTETNSGMETYMATFLVGSFVAICACVGYYAKVTKFKMLVECMERRQPFPPEMFQVVWATHENMLVKEILNCVKTMFECCIDGSVDAETHKKDWEYVNCEILILKAKGNEKSVWTDEKESLDSYLSNDIFSSFLQVKADKLLSQENKIDSAAFQDICVDIFGFPIKSDTMGEYHEQIRIVAKEVYRLIPEASDPPGPLQPSPPMDILVPYGEYPCDAEKGVEMSVNPMTPHESSTSLSISFSDSSQIISALDQVRVALVKKYSHCSIKVEYYEFLRLCIWTPYLKLDLSLNETVVAIKDDVGSIEFKNKPKNELQQPILQNHEDYIGKLQQIIPGSLSDSHILFKQRLDELVFPEFLRAFSFGVFVEFKDLIGEVAKRAGLNPLNDHQVSVADVKGIDRMRVKRGVYQEDPTLKEYPYSAFVTDALRASMICPCIPTNAMSIAWNEINAEPRLTVLRLKNKAVDDDPPFNLHINALFKPQCCPYETIVEIQIQHEDVYSVKKVNHHMYEIVRAPSAEEV